MLDWLENMSDWNISRKRFYGLPLPFYKCECCGELGASVNVAKIDHLNTRVDVTAGNGDASRIRADACSLKYARIGSAVEQDLVLRGDLLLLSELLKLCNDLA